MQPRIGLLAVSYLALFAGCGGGGGGSALPATQTPAVTISSPALRAIVSRTYTVIDLGKQNYTWPGWFLSAGRGSLAINDNGDVVNAMSFTPYVSTTTSLTKLDGLFNSADALNNTGQVVGQTNPGDAAYSPRAAIWNSGAVTDLGSLSQSPSVYNRTSTGFGINDAGQVVGESTVTPVNDNTSPRTHAFSYAKGQLYDLGTLGGYYCRAMAVNNVGQAVGYGPTPNNDQTHAISWHNGSHIDLGTLPGGAYSQANAINDAGQAVGFSNRTRTDLFGSPPPRAVLWQSGGAVDLGTLGGAGSFATGINRDGVVVGSAETAELRATDVTTFGYYYDFFTIYGYGWNFYLPAAQNGGLNSGGGSGFAGGGNGRASKKRAAGDEQSVNVAHAFVYGDKTMFDLNKLLPSGSGWELTQAHAINAKGQIVGLGTFQGQVHGFLLNPK